ncbi:hypothetical protein Q5P01_022774 [Channa striata]|uniref:Uncharacterized protein n=1 Tax=Channa striata TaxID=64152 RepID=A0AA88LRL6_CHASR|nr:hypothetical protein Q5P01_022774 [Channa striata]
MANSAIYLIFAVSPQTLHLRFCCNNTVLEDAASLGRRVRPCRSLSPKGGILCVSPTAERRPFKSSSDKMQDLQQWNYTTRMSRGVCWIHLMSV